MYGIEYRLEGENYWRSEEFYTVSEMVRFICAVLPDDTEYYTFKDLEDYDIPLDCWLL